MEEKKAVLAHEYGHWVYRRKHGFNMPSSKKEEEFADRVSVEVTGSAKGLVDFLQKYQRKRNNRVLMGVGGLELLSLTYRMILGDRELLNGLCSSILRGGISVALLIDNATEIPPTIDTQSSEEMEEMIEKLRSQDNNWFNSGALSNKDVHPILPLRIALAIQHEKRLKEQEIKLCEQHKREQAEFDEVILPALTGA